MRLYLSSFRMGDRIDDLVRSLPADAEVAVISNAADFIPREDRLAYARAVFDPVTEFRSRGLAAREVDLRDHFGRSDGLEADLSRAALVWANGGNAFLLRRAMCQSGLDDLVRRRVADGSLVYGGWSAGAMVAGPSLRGLEVMDDPNVLVDGYAPEPIWQGLGLVDFTFVPHLGSNGPDGEAATRAVDWLAAQGLPFRALRDGEALVV